MLPKEKKKKKQLKQHIKQIDKKKWQMNAEIE